MSHMDVENKQPFPLKLAKITQALDRDIGYWSADGTYFVILVDVKSKKFYNVLKDYFSAKKGDTFVRQLHFYGFSKFEPAGLPKRAWAFSHPDFLRDYPERIALIKRKSSKSTSANTGDVVPKRSKRRRMSVSSSDYEGDDSPAVVATASAATTAHLHALEAKVKRMESKMEEMSRRISEMKQDIAQNEFLFAGAGLQRRTSTAADADSIAANTSTVDWSVDGATFEPRLGECLPSVEPFFLTA